MDRKKLKAELKFDEGFRSHAYPCSAGKWTAGFGHLLEGRVSPEELSQYKRGIKTVTIEQAEKWLDEDMQQATYDAQTFFPQFFELSEVRQRVLVNMAFNLGLGKLMKFKQFRACLQAHEWDQAANEMVDSKWYRQVKGRAERLVKMMREG